MDAGCARSDRAERHVSGRQREVIGVVFANPEEIHADLVGKDPLFDDVADGLRVREGAVILVVRDIAEGVEAEGQWELHGCSTRWCGCHVNALLLEWVSPEPRLPYAASAPTARSNSLRCNNAPKTGPPASSSRPPSNR